MLMEYSNRLGQSLLLGRGMWNRNFRDSENRLDENFNLARKLQAFRKRSSLHMRDELSLWCKRYKAREILRLVFKLR